MLTFQPHNSTQTSLLILQKKTLREMELEKAARQKADYPVFLALANHVGHDKRGNRIYVRDEDGNERMVTKTVRRPEVRDGVTVYHQYETTEKQVDDTTEQIAQAFRHWLREVV